jgi:hypothetical protein
VPAGGAARIDVTTNDHRRESAVALKKSMAGTHAAALTDPQPLAGCGDWLRRLAEGLGRHLASSRSGGSHGASPREIGNDMAWFIAHHVPPTGSRRSDL